MFTKSAKIILSSLLILLCSTFNVYAQTTKELFREPGDPVAGNPNGRITMVEFFDYQCSHCVRMHSVVKSLIRKNKNLRVVYKLLPLRGETSAIATKAALAAVKQNKFNRFSDALLSTSKQLNRSVIMSLAKSSGLNINKLKKDMNSKAIKNKIEGNMQLARNLSLQGTPTFYFGRTNAKNFDNVNSILGSVSLRQLQNAVNAASY